MRQMLTFVVGGAAGIQRAALDARLERGTLPKLKWFGRLHVVVAVHQEVRPACSIGAAARGSRDNYGIPLSRAQASFQANLLAVFQQPRSTRLQIAAVLGLGRNAGETDILTEFGNEPFLVFLQVRED